MSTFPAEVVAAVCRHMNDDHTADSLLIVRAFARADATDAEMTGADAEAGHWRATTAEGVEDVRVAWPGGPITERAEIRREVVALYDAACERLGVARRPEH
ncbi:DUF2470 domain-containing protein [Nocardioides pantholopis]|uniref:DUF2470 domain-containing protein n=1 Tax=Nocardioides pantholopis TaxID=2483798 RepID=UPI000F07B3D4|nr:DUF2470 domain-containing protein [Nocardioides pantholopis]